MARTPADVRRPSDHAPLEGALVRLAPRTTVAAVWKSLACSVVEPDRPPVCTSTHAVPCAVKGFVPDTAPTVSGCALTRAIDNANTAANVRQPWNLVIDILTR